MMKKTDLEAFLATYRDSTLPLVKGRRPIIVDNPAFVPEAQHDVRPHQVVVWEETPEKQLYHSESKPATLERRAYLPIATYRSEIEAITHATPEWRHRKDMLLKLQKMHKRKIEQNEDGFVFVVGYSRKPLGQDKKIQHIAFADTADAQLQTLDVLIVGHNDRKTTLTRYPPADDTSAPARRREIEQGVNYLVNTFGTRNGKHYTFRINGIPVAATPNRFAQIRSVDFPYITTDSVVHELGFENPFTGAKQLHDIRPETIHAFHLIMLTEQEIYKDRRGTKGYKRRTESGHVVRVTPTVEMNPFGLLSEEGLNLALRYHTNMVVHMLNRDSTGAIRLRKDGAPSYKGYRRPTLRERSIFLANHLAQQPDLLWSTKKLVRYELALDHAAYLQRVSQK